MSILMWITSILFVHFIVYLLKDLVSICFYELIHFRKCILFFNLIVFAEIVLFIWLVGTRLPGAIDM